MRPPGRSASSEKRLRLTPQSGPARVTAQREKPRPLSCVWKDQALQGQVSPASPAKTPAMMTSGSGGDDVDATVSAARDLADSASPQPPPRP